MKNHQRFDHHENLDHGSSTLPPIESGAATPSSLLPRSLDEFLEAAAASSPERMTHAHNALPNVHDDDDDDEGNEHDRSSPSRRGNHPDQSSLVPPTNTFPLKSHQWRYWLIFLSLGVCNSSDASEILCISYVLSEPDFQQHILQHTAWRAGMLAAMVFLGMLLGGLWVGASGDVQGRRPMLLIGLATNALAGLASALAPNVYILSLLRLLAGFGIGATVPPLFTLCSELSPPSQRGFWVTVAASFWMVGSIYVALMGWWILGSAGHNNGDHDHRLVAPWRAFAATCAVPSALGWILVARLVPESPRFLSLQGRSRRALHVINRLAHENLKYTGPSLTLAEIQVRHPYTSNPPHQHHPTSSAPGSLSRSSSSSSLSSSVYIVHCSSCGRWMRGSWTEFAQSAAQLYVPSLRSTTLPLQMVWFSLSFGTYGLYTWINTLFFEVHLQNVYYNALLFALSNLPGNVLSAWLMDRTGRASLLTGSVLMAALSLVAFAVVAAQDDQQHQDGGGAEHQVPISRNWIVVSACAFQCFTISAWNSIDVLTSELFPTSVRSTGMGICAASGRIGAMVAQFINGALVAHPAALLLVAAGTLLFGACTPAFLPHDKTGQAVADVILPSATSSSWAQHAPPAGMLAASGHEAGAMYPHENAREAGGGGDDDDDDDDLEIEKLEGLDGNHHHHHHPARGYQHVPQPTRETAASSGHNYHTIV